jgi:hypothetical protein
LVRLAVMLRGQLKICTIPFSWPLPLYTLGEDGCEGQGPGAGGGGGHPMRTTRFLCPRTAACAGSAMA